MPDQALELDALRDLLEESSVVGQLAKNEKLFLSTYQAFRAGNREAFETELRQLGLLSRCRLVCEWIRSKECVFLCLELCGPPPAEATVPDPLQVAEAVIRVTSNPKLLEQLVAALEKRDKAAFARLVEEEKLQAFCHIFCHWACVVRYRLLCRWICGPGGPQPNLVAEFQSAGAALRALVGRPSEFKAAVTASQAGDSAKLGTILQDPGLYQFCGWICEWFCSWRCVLACLTLCRQFPLKLPAQEPQEAYAFAQQSALLAANPLALENLSTAIGTGNVKTYSALVTELKLEPYCLQLCHWICAVRCRRFCVLVCPPIVNHPLFTHVGDFDVDADFDAGGLTNKARLGHTAVLHGGPGFGFGGMLPLNGFCPRTSPIDSSQTMSYRFLVGTTPLQGGNISPVYAGYRWIHWNGPLKRQNVYIYGGVPTADPPPPSLDPNPPDQYIAPDGNGWVSIPEDVQGDAFDGTLLGFDSPTIVPGGTPPSPAGTPPAGHAVTTPENGTNLSITFQATRASTVAAVTGGAAPDYTNELAVIHVNNWAEVHLLDIEEFYAPGANSCSPLSNSLDVLYTVDHELLESWELAVVSASGKTLTSPPPPPGTARGGAGTYTENITSWPTCSYAVQLTTQRKITDGVDDASAWTSQVTFCIGKK